MKTLPFWSFFSFLVEPIEHISKTLIYDKRGITVKKILYVEDDKRLQVLIREELGNEDYDVITASNGKEALSILSDNNRNNIDLIIMDIQELW